MTYHFVAQSISRSGSSQNIEEIEHNFYPRAFLLPSHIIGRIPLLQQQEIMISPGLNQLIAGYELNPLNSEVWLPQDKTYTVLLQEQIDGQVDLFIRRACDQNAEFSGKDAILFIEAALFRYLHDHRLCSVMAIDPYLVWDHGAKDAWPALMDVHKHITQLWAGAGIASLAQRDWHETNGYGDYCDDKCLQANYENIRAELNEHAEKLVAAHDAMAADKKQDTGLPPNLQVAHRLLRYLPPKKQNGTLISYGYNAATGMMPFHGPIPWRGWRDDLLDNLERDLVFESWLLPFQNPISKQWQLQPGSLFLLYWAFDIAGIEPGLSPQEFIDLHDWQGWFGARIEAHEQQ